MLQDLEENNKALVSSSERMRAELERVVKECGLLRRQVGNNKDKNNVKDKKNDKDKS